MSKFVLLTEHRGCGERFPYHIHLEATTWPDARQEVENMLADEEYWSDGLCIGVPADAEIVEVAVSEQIKIKD
jgi:hypothetical protein